MASAVTEVVGSLVIFICVVQGSRSLQIKYEQLLNAAVGQDISLPCIVLEQHEVNINQIEWIKEEESGNKKLVVFNPAHNPHYWAKVTIELVNRTNSAKLQGSILHVHGITEKDRGNYICDIVTFPDGSFKKITTVQVTDPSMSATASSPVDFLIEGDDVNITCVSHPTADSYWLSCLKSNFSMESQSGHFRVWNVTRHYSDLICRPHWNSSNQHLQSLRASVILKVDFLDDIECNSSSQVKAETGDNLTITCEAKSSMPLQYIWKKGNVTVSHNSTISLWSLTLDHAGMYSLTVHTGTERHLQRQRDFVVTVINRTQADEDHQSSTTATEATSLITNGTTLTTAENSTLTKSTHQVQVSTTVYSTTAETRMFINTTAPSAGNITTSQANSTENSSTTNPMYTTSISSPGTTTEAHSTAITTNAPANLISMSITTTQNFSSSTTAAITVKDVKDQSGNKTHVVYALIPILILLVVIIFLYRRYLIQKRLDMPPPFKPPPPPVKYTSVRSGNIPMTDILC
ncbi:nectin-4 [Hoplias malabaricus]|uniref:nectin-4 n=1 Tax=Hoplias malabaricus TaxID=27720 RepID=UPI003462BFA4